LITIKPFNEMNAEPVTLIGFAASKDKFEHKILEDQWSRREKLSPLQRAELFTAAQGHEIKVDPKAAEAGTTRKICVADVRKIAGDAFAILNNADKSLDERKDALLGFWKIYKACPNAEFSDVANAMKTKASEIMTAFLEILGDKSKSPEDRADALLASLKICAEKDSLSPSGLVDARIINANQLGEMRTQSPVLIVALAKKLEDARLSDSERKKIEDVLVDLYGVAVSYFGEVQDAILSKVVDLEISKLTDVKRSVERLRKAIFGDDI
jgi:hypothetical protein